MIGVRRSPLFRVLPHQGEHLLGRLLHARCPLQQGRGQRNRRGRPRSRPRAPGGRPRGDPARRPADRRLGRRGQQRFEVAGAPMMYWSNSGQQERLLLDGRRVAPSSSTCSGRTKSSSPSTVTVAGAGGSANHRRRTARRVSPRNSHPSKAAVLAGPGPREGAQQGDPPPSVGTSPHPGGAVKVTFPARGTPWQSSPRKLSGLKSCPQPEASNGRRARRRSPRSPRRPVPPGSARHRREASGTAPMMASSSSADTPLPRCSDGFIPVAEVLKHRPVDRPRRGRQQVAEGAPDRPGS